MRCTSRSLGRRGKNGGEECRGRVAHHLNAKHTDNKSRVKRDREVLQMRWLRMCTVAVGMVGHISCAVLMRKGCSSGELLCVPLLFQFVAEFGKFAKLAKSYARSFETNEDDIRKRKLPKQQPPKIAWPLATSRRQFEMIWYISRSSMGQKVKARF